MSSWISNDGVWHPKNEKVGLVNNGDPFKNPKTGEMVNTGDPYVYDGPCRRALFELWEANGKPSEKEMKDKKGEMTLGTDFRKSPEFIEMIRKLDFKTADEYLSYVGYDKDEVKKRFEEQASVVLKHELPSKVKRVESLGGGQDYSGAGNDKFGGFGVPAEIK